MELQGSLCFVLVFFTLVSISQARIFYVGGSAGWVPNPAENYNQWAGRNRFQINDILVFKYNNGSDSVLEVTKVDYDGCNKSNPIKKFDDGETEFKFDKTGPFYFISGEDGNCEKGEKLIVVVLAIRGGGKQTQTPPPSSNTPATSPTPVTTNPTSSPVPSSEPPADSPPPPANGVASGTPSSFLVYAFTVVVGAALLR
ncbi:PREDICTED: early nodulin-like protein 2 isoform X1 [Lupinus angustifolius]|uniref:early nodulin-like protein 2 isoform X1 n=1 Tax=Lupinus angustifolius TaxID=3871 RepID=UPI00092F62D8|nr:PREDICTED: early nodulin-like protein 2 isoform X1 [Lupinus angustifolius]